MTNILPKVGRPSNSDRRRSEIVGGLLAVMAKEGYARASVAAIAKAAGLAPGLLHYHFDNKREILVALVEKLASAAAARADGALAKAGADPRERLTAYAEAYVALGEGADPKAVAAWVALGTEALREKEVRSLYTAAVESSLERLRSLILACLDAEGRTTRNAKRIAAAILSAIEGAYRVSAAAPGVLPEGFAAPMLRRMIRGLLDAEERS